MKLRGVKVVDRRHLPNGVTNVSLSWDFLSERYPSIDVYHGDLNYFAVLGGYISTVAVLRERAPFAYVLTNNGIPEDPRPSYASSSRTLDPSIMANRPYAKLGFDYFAESNVLRREQISYLIAFGREDLSLFHEELLGLTMSPLQGALLLAKEEGLEEWISTPTSRAASDDEWMSLLLDRFSLFLWVHEGERLFLMSKEAGLLESLGLTEPGVQGHGPGNRG